MSRNYKHTKEYMAKYRDKHRERLRAYNRARYWQPEAVAKRKKDWPINRIKQRIYEKRWRDKRPPLVYRWRDGNGVIEYVGRGTFQRLRAHITKSNWWTPEHTYSYMVCRNEWHAMHLEGLWGELFQPRRNVEGYRHGKRGG